MIYFFLSKALFLAFQIPGVIFRRNRAKVDGAVVGPFNQGMKGFLKFSFSSFSAPIYHQFDFVDVDACLG